MLLLHEERRHVALDLTPPLGPPLVVRLGSDSPPAGHRPACVEDLPITLLDDAIRLVDTVAPIAPDRTVDLVELRRSLVARRELVADAINPSRLYFCASPGCQGMPWPASEHPHLGCARSTDELVGHGHHCAAAAGGVA